MYYSVIGLLAGIVLLIINYDILLKHNGVSQKPAWKVYRRFLIAVMVYYVTDILWGILESHKLAGLLFADTTVYYGAMAAGVFFWAQYTVTYLEDESRFGRLLVHIGRVIAVMITILAAVNVAIPVLFTVDSHCVYRALPFRYVMLVIQIAFLLMISSYAVSSIFLRENARKQKNRALALFGSIMALFLFLQLWFPYLPLYSIAYMLGTCLLHTFVINDEKEEYRVRLEEAYEKEHSTNTVFTHVARSLARGYTDLYYVNIKTDEFIEFFTDDESGVLTEARRGADFFEGCKRDVKLGVHPEDEEIFVRTMDPVFLNEVLDRSKVYEFTYRRIKEGRTFYVRMKITRMEENDQMLVMAVTDVDEQMKQRLEEEQTQEERVIFARLHALMGNFICGYVVDPATGHYREFGASAGYAEGLRQAREGTDFFATAREEARIHNYPKDLNYFLEAFTRDNLMEEIERRGIFTLSYRLNMGGRPVHVQLRAVMMEEDEGPSMIVSINDIDAQVRQEEEYGRRLAHAQSQANIDALTGIKNKHAYLEVETRMDRMIDESRQEPFAVSILDVNDLKKINDTAGHQAGDQCIRDACRVICETFRHSPVFRVGGDEFAVISQGHDYECIGELLEKMSEYNAEAALSGKVIIACGMSKFDNDECVAQVFERADQNMYDNKNLLKSARN